MMKARLLACAALVACDGSSSGVEPDAGGSGSGGDGGGSATCERVPGAADRVRYAVVAHPYDADGNSVGNFEVLQLSATGTLTRFSPPRMFMLGNRMPFGNIAFTPDGELGIAPLDNGMLAVFKLDGEGIPTVLEAGLRVSAYASRVVMDSSGDRAWVVDRNTRANGGGIYEIGIGCDGVLADRGKVAEARSPGGLALRGTQAIIAARDVLDSPTTVNDVHIVELASTPSYMGGGDAFGDDDQIFGGFALSHDGATAFIGDTNVVGQNRVAVASVGATTASSLQVINNLNDPSSIVVSPFGDVAVVTSAQPPSEGIYVLDKGGAGNTWRNRGELTYVGGAAQLPGDMVLVDRGTLRGRVLVSELSRIRLLTIGTDGSVVDTSSLVFGDGLDEIAGAIGIQP